MSGHSKWSQIKHKKAATDKKRGQIFSKLARAITVAAKEKGGDPALNAALRVAMEKAGAANMPAENIERAIGRGIGGGESALEIFNYEAYGPGGVAFIIEGITDNKNRTVSELRHLLNSHGGKLADSGSVAWMFDRVGIIEIEKTNSNGETELKIIEAGARDLEKGDAEFFIYTEPQNMDGVKNNLISAGFKIKSAILGWREKNPMEITDSKIRESIAGLLEALDDHDDVQEVYSNLI